MVRKLKASLLIYKLQSMIEQYGDTNVAIADYSIDFYDEMRNVSYDESFYVFDAKSSTLYSPEKRIVLTN